MDVAWTCLDTARLHLAPGGSLLLQLGTVEQVDAVRERLRGDELSVTEVRWHERGVLVRDRPAASSAAAPPAAPCGCRRTTAATPT